MICDIEKLRTELQSRPLCKRDILEQREVHILDGGPPYDVAPFVAELSCLRDGI